MSFLKIGTLRISGIKPKVMKSVTTAINGISNAGFKVVTLKVTKKASL
jgi:hypothetical protein